MTALTQKYLIDQIEAYQIKLHDTQEKLESQTSWVLKGENILNTYFEKCASLKKLIIAPIVAVTSTVISAAAIIALKEIFPGLLPFIICGSTNIIVVGGSIFVYIKNSERYKRQKTIINESNRFAPSDFEKLPTGELSAECDLSIDYDKQTRLEGLTREYKNYIKGLENIYDKLVEEESNEKRLEEENQIKQNEFIERVEAEWDAYLEEISKINPADVHLTKTGTLKNVDPITLNLTPDHKN